MEYILKKFPITDNEWFLLEKKYSKLCEYAAWQLLKSNSNSCNTDDQTDISQELKIAVIIAASYFKRQTFIESCLEICKNNVKDNLIKKIVLELDYLWKNKKHHGANKQRFGIFQETLLEKITNSIISKPDRPSKNAPLLFNSKFNTYCKHIIWNRQKTLGKMYTRERPIRRNMVSLSEHDYISNLVSER